MARILPGQDDVSFFKPDVLQGRVVLVTGGGSGIGFEIAAQFGKFGAKVAIMGRRQAFLEDALTKLADMGVNALGVAGDIRKPEDCAAAVQKTVDAFGSLDVLVNSAAGNFLSVAEQLSPSGFKTIMDINALGTFTMTRAAFESLRASKFGGVVTSITSTRHYAAAWWQVTGAAKAAIDAFTRNLALEWGEYGIRCNCIAPGPTEGTPGMAKLSGGRGAKDMKFPDVPLGRAGTKAELASTAIFLCLNTYITGQVLVVDGGNWFGKPPSIPREMVSKVSRGVERGSRDMGAGAVQPGSKL